MTPNYICPCCGHRGQLTATLVETILQVVAANYGLTPHDVEWGGHSSAKMAMQARNVALYFTRSFSAATNKEINRIFHMVEHSSNATLRFYQIVELCEQDAYFAKRVDELEEQIILLLKEKSMPHAICG